MISQCPLRGKKDSFDGTKTGYDSELVIITVTAWITADVLSQVDVSLIKR